MPDGADPASSARAPASTPNQQRAPIGAGGATVGDELQDLVRRLAARLHAEVDAVIADARRRADAALATQREVADGLRKQNGDLAAKLLRARLGERVRGLEAELAARDKRIEALEKEYQHAPEELDQFWIAAK